MLSAVSAARANESGPSWIYDLEAAKTTAKSEGKDVLVVFTGRGWCQPCELLDAKVFQNEEFVKSTKAGFLFVELDSNFGDSDEEKEREARLTKLKDKYLVNGVPKVILMDVDGVPFAIWNGYSKELGPQDMAETMAKARRQKLLRDKCFEQAMMARSDEERVNHLHDGLEAVVANLGLLEGNSDDALFTFYETQVADILKSSHKPGAEVRSIYAARKSARESRIANQSSVETRDEKLAKFISAQDYRGAIGYIDSILDDVTDANAFWMLQLRRQQYLEADSDFEGAIENSQRLTKSDSIPDRIREMILDSVARCLAASERLPEAIAQYDHRIKTSEGDTKKTLRLLYSKANMTAYQRDNRQRIEAWKDYREFAEPRTFEWLTGTAFLARELQKSEKYEEAASLFRQVIETLDAGKRGEVELRWPWSADSGHFVMLEAADCHLALGQLDAASGLADRAAKSVDRLTKSPRVGDNKDGKRLQDMVTALREKIEKKSDAR